MASIPVSMTSIEEYDPAGVAPAEDAPADNRPALELIQNSIFDGEFLGGVYYGRKPGVQLLAMTNRRLIMLESTTVEGQVCLTSIPGSKLTSVGYIRGRAGEGHVGEATTVALKVLHMVYEVICDDHETARELHDELAWGLITD